MSKTILVLTSNNNFYFNVISSFFQKINQANVKVQVISSVSLKTDFSNIIHILFSLHPTDFDIYSSFIEQLPDFYSGSISHFASDFSRFTNNSQIANLLDMTDFFFVDNFQDKQWTIDRYTSTFVFLISNPVYYVFDKITKLNWNGVSKLGFNIRTNLEFVDNFSQNYKTYLLSTHDEYNNLTNTIIIPKINTILDMQNYIKNLDFLITDDLSMMHTCLVLDTPFILIQPNYIDLPSRNDHGVFFRNQIINSFDKNQIETIIQNFNYNLFETARTNYFSVYPVPLNYLQAIGAEFQVSIIRKTPPHYITTKNVNKIVSSCIMTIVNSSNIKLSPNQYDKLFMDQSLLELPTELINDDNFQNRIVQEILWNITGDPWASYFDEIKNNILNIDFVDNLKIIINDYNSTYFYKNNNKHITVLNTNFETSYKSNWQAKMALIVQHNFFDSVNFPIVMDLYVDKTFLYSKDFYKSKNVIPFKVPWIGCIQNTFNNYSNNLTVDNLLKNKEFKESLPYCACLFVFSNYLKRQLLVAFGKNAPRIEFIHLTSESPDTLFTWNRFIANPNKTIVQIGTTLRNVFGIYRLDLPLNSLITSKSIIKESNSTDLFLPNDFKSTFLQNSKTLTLRDNTVIFENKHMRGLFDTIQDMESSVNVIPKLDDANFDHLLSQNIVFLQMVDASGVDTLIDCILRNTPILINPLPAIVEILGSGYPLYYNNYFQASSLLTQTDTIQNAYTYLSNIDKTPFLDSTFVTELQNFLIEILSG